MKTVIVFREGQSGNYLKSMILNNSPMVQFRMPENHVKSNITLTHENNYQLHKLQYDVVLRILPTRKIYLAIYNNFMKKLIAEEYFPTVLHSWHANPVYWYDRCYYNIVEYHNLITQDIQTNCYPNMIDFDQLLNKDYLSSILPKYFQVDFDHSREKIRKSYEDLQLTLELDQNKTSMEHITDVLTDDLLAKNPWFFSYCIHKYETANNLEPKNRLWSVNNLAQIPDKQLLLTLAQQYTQSLD